jgi:uncharacterized protein DUF4342
LKEALVGQTWETFRVTGDDLLRRVKEIVHEGNVRHVRVKQGPRTVVEFPVTVGVVSAVAAPALVALGAAAVLLSQCTIEVERQTGGPPVATPRTARSTRKRA